MTANAKCPRCGKFQSAAFACVWHVVTGPESSVVSDGLPDPGAASSRVEASNALSEPVGVAEARQLADDATAGPWTVESEGGVDYTGEGWYHVMVNFADPIEPHAGLMIGDHENADADAAFIAWCRTGVPALLDELDRVRGDLASTRQQLTEVKGRKIWLKDDAQEWKIKAGELRQQLARYEQDPNTRPTVASWNTIVAERDAALAVVDRVKALADEVHGHGANTLQAEQMRLRDIIGRIAVAALEGAHENR